jgi:hypothetical protein
MIAICECGARAVKYEPDCVGEDGELVEAAVCRRCASTATVLVVTSWPRLLFFVGVIVAATTILILGMVRA